MNKAVHILTTFNGFETVYETAGNNQSLLGLGHLEWRETKQNQSF